MEYEITQDFGREQMQLGTSDVKYANDKYTLGTRLANDVKN
jgi:hypothetical protein